MYKKLLVTIAGFSLLAGCGGGSGGVAPAAGPTYKGVTTQAVVTNSNAKVLSADAYDGAQVSSAAANVSKQAEGQRAPLLQETAGLLEGSVSALFSSKTSSKAVAATAQDTIYGYSGSYTYSINVNQATGAFDGTISFSQYGSASTSPRLNGSIAFSGVFNQQTDSFSSLNITMTSVTSSYGNRSFTMAGSISYSYSISSRVITMSVLLTDNNSGRTYWEKDFTMTLSAGSLTISGTYYDPLHGYVVISTLTPLAVSSFDGSPTAGQLLFTGQNGTKARLTFNNGSYTVEADTNGSGNFVAVP